MPKLGSLTVSAQGFGAMGLSNVYGPAIACPRSASLCPAP